MKERGRGVGKKVGEEGEMFDKNWSDLDVGGMCGGFWGQRCMDIG